MFVLFSIIYSIFHISAIILALWHIFHLFSRIGEWMPWCAIKVSIIEFVSILIKTQTLYQLRLKLKGCWQFFLLCKYYHSMWILCCVRVQKSSYCYKSQWTSFYYVDIVNTRLLHRSVGLIFEIQMLLASFACMWQRIAIVASLDLFFPIGKKVLLTQRSARSHILLWSSCLFHWTLT